MTKSSSLIRYSINGTAAGIFSAFIFTVIHDIFISDIWFSLTSMLIAGALCGFFVSWSFRLVVKKPTVKEWYKYNLIYVILFILLGTISAIIYEPVTTVAELIIRNEPPRELIIQAAPMTSIFTLGSALIISIIYSRKLLHHLAIFVTCVVLVVLLGLNVSLIGLVFFPNDTFYLIIETYGLILAINTIYCAGFIALQWKSLHYYKIADINL